MLDKNKKYALSLEGGGFKGSYQAGAILALHENGIKFSAVCGTSVGALNGIFVAMDIIPKLKELWLNFKIQDVFEIQNDDLEKALKLDFNNINLKDLGKGIIDTSFNGGLNVAPLINLIDNYVNEDLARKSDIDFGLVTVNVSELKNEELMLDDMPKGSLKNYLLASSYLPVFKQQKLNGNYYLDGGFYNNLPSNMLENRGYDEIIQIRLQKISRIVKTKNIAKLNTISPKDSLGAIIIYNKDRILQNFENGYQDALDFLKKD